MFFISWLNETYNEEKPLYLGGSLPGHLIRCIRICSCESFSCRSLQCDHEEADYRLLYHILHAVRVENF